MNPTRGNGILEGILARQRTKVADSLIPESARTGRILDIGCGTSPYFLSTIRFNEKHGLDKVFSAEVRGCRGQNIFIQNYDLEHSELLPYDDDYFDVVTMLAVFEHIEPIRLLSAIGEVSRVLKSGGYYILTTPAAWTDRLLRIMAGLGLVSREEIEEHKDAYSHTKIKHLLERAGFDGGNIQCGYFEIFMNLWVKARC